MNFTKLLLKSRIMGIGGHAVDRLVIRLCLITMMLPFYEPTLDVVHALFQCTDMTDGPLFELFKTFRDHEECPVNIKSPLSIELSIDWWGLTRRRCGEVIRGSHGGW